MLLCLRLTPHAWFLYQGFMAKQRRKFSIKKDGQCTCKRNIEGRSCNQCCSGKKLSFKYYENMSVALGIQYTKRMRQVESMACFTVPYFSTLSHTRHNFRGKKSLSLKHVYWVSIQIFPATFLTIKKIRRDIIINVRRSSRKVPVILVRF
jgi:hypothetical protein